jgi:hypothetical protein
MEYVSRAFANPGSFVADLFRPREGSLYSPAADVMMAGGLSILCFVFMWFFVGKGTDITAWSLAVYYAAFFVNYPHFMASYLLIYRDARPSFTAFKEHRVFAYKLWWAGVVVPLILVAFFSYALLSANLALVGYMANAMFFFVGWHYVKQIYGCVIVLSSAKKVYYTWYERWSFLVPLYALWAISFVNANLYGGQNSYYQIVYNAAKIPEAYLEAAYAILAASTFVMVALIATKIVRERRAPPVAAMVALLSIYVWYIPALSHPFYLYIVPLFHSLQYLLFVTAYERNKTFAMVREKSSPKVFVDITKEGSMLFLALPAIVILVLMLWEPTAALDYLMVAWYGTLGAVTPVTWLKTIVILLAFVFAARYVKRRSANDPKWGFASFFFTAFVLGILMFAVFPTIFDILVRNRLLPGNLSYDYRIFGVSLYLYFFTVLINVHHYFIDNVIWKGNNPHIRAHLFAPKTIDPS